MCRVNIIETWRTAAHTPVKRGSRLRPAVRSSLFDETAARAKDPKRELPILLEPLREIRLARAMISNWFTAESKHCGSFSRNGIQLKRRGKKKSIIIIILWIEFLNEKRLLDQFSGLNGMFSARSIFIFFYWERRNTFVHGAGEQLNKTRSSALIRLDEGLWGASREEEEEGEITSWCMHLALVRIKRLSLRRFDRPGR